jgi:glutathione peroxidase-family protein
MKSIHHPNILNFQDGIENDKAIFIVTERVQPLYNYLKESQDNQSQKENEIAWGLYQIAVRYLAKAYQSCLIDKNLF